MLTTVRMRRPLAAVHLDPGSGRGAQRDVQHRSTLRRIDLLAGEHRLDVSAQAGPFGQGDEQGDGRRGEPVLRIVEVDAVRLGGERLPAGRVLGEQPAQVHVGDFGGVLLERRPLGRRVDRNRVLQVG
jgi:hypothetical protein